MSNHSDRTRIWAGIQAAWPICLGYFPIGAAFGVLAQKAGLSPLETGLMSVLVFAGSSQFIGVAMLAEGAGAAAIVATTFIVNLRHMLMSAALAVPLGRESRSRLTLFAYGVTDESFALNLPLFKQGQWGLTEAIALNQTANATWIFSSFIGAWGGEFIPPGAFGIDYALAAMFICLLIFQLRGRVYLFTAVVAAVLAVGLSLIIPGNSYVIFASITAAAIGAIVKNRNRKHSRHAC